MLCEHRKRESEREREVHTYLLCECTKKNQNHCQYNIGGHYTDALMVFWKKNLVIIYDISGCDLVNFHNIEI